MRFKKLSLLIPLGLTSSLLPLAAISCGTQESTTNNNDNTDKTTTTNPTDGGNTNTTTPTDGNTPTTPVGGGTTSTTDEKETGNTTISPEAKKMADAYLEAITVNTRMLDQFYAFNTRVQEKLQKPNAAMKNGLNAQIYVDKRGEETTTFIGFSGLGNTIYNQIFLIDTTKLELSNLLAYGTKKENPKPQSKSNKYLEATYDSEARKFIVTLHFNIEGASETPFTKEIVFNAAADNAQEVYEAFIATVEAEKVKLEVLGKDASRELKKELDQALSDAELNTIKEKIITAVEEAKKQIESLRAEIATELEKITSADEKDKFSKFLESAKGVDSFERTLEEIKKYIATQPATEEMVPSSGSEDTMVPGSDDSSSTSDTGTMQPEAPAEGGDDSSSTSQPAMPGTEKGDSTVPVESNPSSDANGSEKPETSPEGDASTSSEAATPAAGNENESSVETTTEGNEESISESASEEENNQADAPAAEGASTTPTTSGEETSTVSDSETSDEGIPDPAAEKNDMESEPAKPEAAAEPMAEDTSMSTQPSSEETTETQPEPAASVEESHSEEAPVAEPAE
ncbi:hypothetical protein H9M94_02715 [Mycoplasma sp. Pen4]|uniref:hypothetical protein n=1 Tax=Mycoplasma sp. Pen4 TaxID=640330 RepID=UPI0016541218|nr:hypothetical protein [Mycoplasma sp. Pen4]QNM93498.1 hypothetical protein H9M94_02715 [Mycoplasma sp. Pen4]